jgi:nitrogen fixation/metabolism regulation signal transduction histidine kinase
LAFLLFRIRRFKRGFPFLLKGYAVVVALIVAGVVLTIVTGVNMVYDTDDFFIITYFILAMSIVGAGIYIGIRRGIKAIQRRWAREDNTASYRQEVAGLTQELQQERAVNENLRSANHSLNHRLAAMERSVLAMLERHQQTVSTEISEDFAITIADIRRLSKEHAANVGRVKHDAVLPSTNVKTIDGLFGLFADRFAASDIRFKLTVTGSIVYMTENTIAPGKLETLIGDLLQNALIAVNASDASIRSIMAVIGETGDCYEFTVYDGGVPFEVDTLVRLGTERVTTHAEEGGSGVGFMKTFEIMRECNASLIITEIKSGVFSKAITIRFDGENQYKIASFRSDEFPENERYTVVA